MVQVEPAMVPMLKPTCLGRRLAERGQRRGDRAGGRREELVRLRRR